MLETKRTNGHSNWWLNTEQCLGVAPPQIYTHCISPVSLPLNPVTTLIPWKYASSITKILFLLLLHFFSIFERQSVSKSCPSDANVAVGDPKGCPSINARHLSRTDCPTNGVTGHKMAKCQGFINLNGSSVWTFSNTLEPPAATLSLIKKNI